MDNTNNNNSNKDILKEKDNINLDINIFKKKINKLKGKFKKNKKDLMIFKKKCSQLNKDIYNNNLRYQADIDNLNKRNNEYIKNIYKYSLEKFIKSLLPVVDNLKNALKSSKNKNLNINITTEGIELTFKNFLSILKKNNVKIINDIDIDFNPNYHQAVVVVNIDDIKKDNKIIEVLQEGYLLNNRLLRPAMVKVFKYIKCKK